MFPWEICSSSGWPSLTMFPTATYTGLRLLSLISDYIFQCLLRMLCALVCAWNDQVNECWIFHLLSELIKMYPLSYSFLLISIIFIQLLRDWKHWQNVTFWGTWKLELPSLKTILLAVIWKAVSATMSSNRNNSFLLSEHAPLKYCMIWLFHKLAVLFIQIGCKDKRMRNGDVTRLI